MNGVYKMSYYQVSDSIVNFKVCISFPSGFEVKSVLERIFCFFNVSEIPESHVFLPMIKIEAVDKKLYTLTLHTGSATYFYDQLNLQRLCGAMSEFAFLPQILDSSEWFYLHGGAVSKDDIAIVFLGGTHAGKSTLVTRCVHLGYQYMTDDIVPVNILNLEIAPFPKCIYIRDKKWVDDGKNYVIVDPFEIHLQDDSRFIVKPISIAERDKRFAKYTFIQLNRNSESECKLVKQAVANAFPILYSNSRSHLDMHKNRKMSIELAKKASLYTLHYDEADIAVREITRHFFE